MARNEGVRIEGLNQTVKSLVALGADIDDLKDAFQPIADEGAQIGARAVDSKTGRLAGTARGNRAKNKAVVTFGRASVPYAGVQNYGWPKRNIRAQDFTGAVDRAMETRAPELLQRNIDDLIEKRGLA